MLFASVHVDGFQNPGNNSWNSADCTIPKGHKRAFEVRVCEELLPPGVATGSLQNEVVLAAFERWGGAVSKQLHSFKPNGVFVGLGFDLHKFEQRIGDKEFGLGIEGQHYNKL